MVRDTGSPRADAESDFLRARRHQVLSALAAWVRNDSHDVVKSLSFTEAVDALGRRGERNLGVQVIPMEAIVGSVDKVRDFDRRFRPTSGRSRERWERMARKSRTGEAFPPIEVYKLGELYFVRDGHHRVSVGRALGAREIEAHVTEIDTVISTTDVGRRSDLDRLHWRRLFLQRVPLTGPARAEIQVTNPVFYARLAESIEAWATRLMHHEETYLDQPTMAQRWYDEEYLPVLAMIDEADVRGPDETGADAYIRVARERYRLIREHAWNSDVMARISQGSRRGRSNR